ncbi:hypothetical protein N480_05610 [Pseudoalteromonas luteoviolacea S2607]|nr:hypothetical protein N480_05610 [Pseudoalteromonas luteoviolacea S2607]
MDFNTELGGVINITLGNNVDATVKVSVTVTQALNALFIRLWLYQGISKVFDILSNRADMLGSSLWDFSDDNPTLLALLFIPSFITS